MRTRQLVVKATQHRKMMSLGLLISCGADVRCSRAWILCQIPERCRYCHLSPVEQHHLSHCNRLKKSPVGYVASFLHGSGLDGTCDSQW